MIAASGAAELTRPLVRCPNCGALCVDLDGPTHPYLVANPGCWASFATLQADESARFGYPPVHGLIVDAYAASHGGDGSERRDRQSVCVHLIALCALLERDEPLQRRVAILQRLTRRKVDWPLLERPPGVPELNHTHAVGAVDADDYTTRAREWASGVWEFWAPEHERIRALLDARGGG